uniref:Uncharacterized protein n=1 Tax=Chrysodeixis chalcites nucleopolyhedrovirus TaxID=320432 RepID=T1R0K3_9ABAC|nr:hypothetical protein [Chrysodeixis chalcites nucleopolyhedrovirus]
MADNSKIDVVNQGVDVDEITINIADTYKCVVMKCVIFKDATYCINCASKFAAEDLSNVILKSNHQLFSISHGFDTPDLDGQTRCSVCEAWLFKLYDSTKCDECFNTVLSLFNHGLNNGYVILSN